MSYRTERAIAQRLQQAVAGLPSHHQSEIVDNLRAEIYALADHYALKAWTPREAALRQATEDVLGDPVKLNRRFVRAYLPDILHCAWHFLACLPGHLWRKLVGGRRRYTAPPFGPDTALCNDPELRACISDAFGEAFTDTLYWPETFAWPFEFLGCLATDDYLVFAVGHEIWENYGCEYYRHITYYSLAPDDPIPRPAASTTIQWNDENGIVYPLNFERGGVLTDHSALAAQLSTFCLAWLEPECKENATLIAYVSDGEQIVIGPRYEPAGPVAPIWYRLPDFGERQLTWSIMLLSALCLVAVFWLAGVFTPVAAPPTDVTPLPPPPFPVEALPPPTWQDYLQGAGIVLILLGIPLILLASVGIGLYYLSREAAQALLLRTPLGVPKALRPLVFGDLD